MVVQLHHHKYIFTDFLWVVYVICYSTPGESAQQCTVYLQALSICQILWFSIDILVHFALSIISCQIFSACDQIQIDG